jgi:hypothetical protein
MAVASPHRFSFTNFTPPPWDEMGEIGEIDEIDEIGKTVEIGETR